MDTVFSKQPLDQPPFIISLLLSSIVLVLCLYLTKKSSGLPNGGSEDSNKSIKRAIKQPKRILYDPAIRAIFTDSLGDLNALHFRHGDIVTVSFLGEPACLVGGLSNIKAVLNNSQNFIADLPKPMIALLGKGNIQTVHGKEHARDRKTLSPIFAPNNIKGYVPRLAQLASTTVREWLKRSTEYPERGVSGYEEIRKYVIRIALELILGFKIENTEEDQYAFLSQLYLDLWAGFFTIPLDLPGSNYRKALKARDKLRETILENLENALAQLNLDDDSPDGPDGSTALELLLRPQCDEQGNTQPVDRDHVLSMLSSLVLGAVDTTATTLLLAIRNLALHPDVLDKARREQAGIISKHGYDINGDTLSAMTYIDCILRETIRCQSPVQIVFRRSVAETEVGGFTIPAGRKILVHVGESIVNDSRWVNEKMEERIKFNPDRWEGDTKVGGWMPFGGGTRLCPGQQLAWTEMKTLIAAVARTGCGVELLKKDERWKVFPLQRPVNGMPMRLVSK